MRRTTGLYHPDAGRMERDRRGHHGEGRKGRTVRLGPVARAAVAIALGLLSLAVRQAGDVTYGEFTYVLDAPGKVVVAIEKGNAAGRLTAADASQFTANLQRVRDLLVARPVLQNLRGLEIAGSIHPDDSAVAPREPVPAKGFLRYCPILRARNGKPFAYTDSSWQIAVGINKPCLGLDGPNLSSDPRLYYEPKPGGEVDGVRVYTVKNGSELIVFTRSGRTPWVPVTREEYARIWTGLWKKEAASMPPAGAAMMQGVIDKLEAKLRAMTPEERQMQARSGFELSPVNAGGLAIVKADPGWFDAALPRSAIHVISLQFDYSGDLDFTHPEATRNPAPLRVWQTLHRSAWADLRSALAR